MATPGSLRPWLSLGLFCQTGSWSSIAAIFQPSYCSQQECRGEGQDFPISRRFWKYHAALLFIDLWPDLQHVDSFPLPPRLGNIVTCQQKTETLLLKRKAEVGSGRFPANSVLPGSLVVCSSCRTIIFWSTGARFYLAMYL